MAEHVPVVNGEFVFTLPTSAAVTAGNCLVISGSGTVAKSGGAGNAFVGIAAFDAAASGVQMTIQCGGVHDLVSSGAITAGGLVEVAASGAVAAHTEGTNDDRAIGVAVTTASGNVCRVRLFR
jgi:uncharacterized protein DUF2190